ncbi:MAG: hypothetical protein O3C21_03315 [Verrucomicrobia bacterium]|nr:hypothetical protein [Verrucomicrobiota bacterium]
MTDAGAASGSVAWHDEKTEVVLLGKKDWDILWQFYESSSLRLPAQEKGLNDLCRKPTITPIPRCQPAETPLGCALV